MAHGSMSTTLERSATRASMLGDGAADETAMEPLTRTMLPDAVNDRLFFAQVREDPRAELAALRPGADDVVVVVSSGGCTALSLLAAGAGRVVAVDRNAAQNHLVELKAAATSLGARAAVEFLGALPSRARADTYAALRHALTPAARGYWDERPAAIARGVLHAGVSERFIGMVVTAMRLAVHPSARVDRLLACRTLDEQRALYEREWNSWRWRAMYALLCNRMALRTTYPAQFFAHVENPSFARYFHKLAEHALTELPVANNYFLHEMFTGRYPLHELDGAPPYLSAAGAAAVSDARQQLELVDGSMTTHLRTCPARSVDAFALSNICEWMSQEEVDELFREILRTAAPGARLVYRNFVGWTELPAWCGRIAPDEALSERLSGEDRSLMQRRVVACRITEAG
jgi:S-adenosylmethionine-diacylglycerol 3-amino-3-carboxypropyl transferase